MANPDHLTLLAKGSRLLNSWRVEQPAAKLDLSGSDLAGYELEQAELSRADLTRADLTGAKLRGANLSEADLQQAHLERADLSYAELSGANLFAAHTAYADLSNSVLDGADLRRTNLACANLTRCSLANALISDALFAATIVADVDLSGVGGLEHVNHHGPSNISTSSLERTATGLAKNASRQGQIEAFIRGAGVSETYLDAFQLSIGQPIEFYSCFISYSHNDKSFARRLHADLQAQGIRCWLDEHQMLPGDDIYDAVDRGIRLWDKILLCCSESSLTSWWVGDEIDKALEKEHRLMQERSEKVFSLVPLNLDGYLFDEWAAGRASTIKRRLAADFTGWEKDHAKFEQGLERVIRSLRTSGRGREKAPAPRL